MDILSGSSETEHSLLEEAQARVEPLRLFVGCIPRQMKENQLRRYFLQFGCTRTSRISRSGSGKTRGYAYLQFRDRESLEKVMLLPPSQLTFAGSQLKVERLIESPCRQSVQKLLGERRLYLSGIPSSVSAEEIWNVISRFGQIKWMTKLRRRYPPSTPPSFYCYVTMDRREVTDSLASIPAIEIVEGININIKHFLTRSERKSSKITKDSKISPALANPSGYQHMQERASKPKMGIDRLAPLSLEQSPVLQTGSISTITSPEFKMIRSLCLPLHWNAHPLGLRTNLHVGQEGGTHERAPNSGLKQLKIRESLSISMIPNNHDHHCSENLRFRIQLR